MILASSQIQASCVYSPPPMLSHGQGADTLGTGSMAVTGEAGWGAAGSWWKAKNIGDPEVNSGAVGAGRLRLGLTENLDVGIVGGLGPERTFVLGPESKWRFARLASSGAEGEPAFHAAVISGLGIGAADYRYGMSNGEKPRNIFLAPYTGVIASGGIRFVQMFTGLRIAASETLGNDRTDLTVYPVLAFGVHVRPDRLIGIFAESDLAGGITTRDIGDTALLGYASVGVTLTFDRLWSHGR